MVILVGILNITPDSFSDGGCFDKDPQKAINHALFLIKQGADIIDVGAESTRPNAVPITEDEEWQRLKDVLPQLLEISKKENVKVSLDSRHSNNIIKAINLGIDIVNDVSGFADKDLAEFVANFKPEKQIILMHNLGVPADKSVIIDQNLDEILEIKKWALAKIDFLQNLGIKKENIIFDPGIGFGKNAVQSGRIIKNIDQFNDLGLDLLVGHSRKSFLNQFSFDSHNISYFKSGAEFNEVDKDVMTLEVSKILVSKKVKYLRIHNISSHSILKK